RARGCGGGLLSVALSRGSLRVGVTHHRAGWSPDFPRPRGRSPEDAAARPTGPGPSYVDRSLLLAAAHLSGRDVRKLSSALPGPAARTAQNGRMLIMLPPSETKTRPSEVDAAT